MTDHFSWISHFMRSLYREGVRHIYISPGSRSTPLALSAAVHPGFQKHVVLDERSAGFQALGIGKSTGKPAVLICTSGTAVTNYFPAIAEARQSGTPLIVLTADRPPYLRYTGSSQTIDQLKIFGSYAVMFHELGEPVHQDPDLKRLELLARQAVTDSVHFGGAVQINAPFRKPLEPASESIEIEHNRNQEQVEELKDASKIREITSKNTLSDPLFNLINHSNRPLVIGGPETPERVLNQTFTELLRCLQAPVLCEPGSNLPAGDFRVTGYESFLRSPEVADELKPDLILLFGESPFGKSLQAFLETYREVETIQFLNRESWQDSAFSVNHRVILPSDQVTTTGLETKQKTWFQKWKKESETVDSLKLELLNNSDELTDAHIYAHFTGFLPDNWQMMLSNSFTVRDFSMFGEAVKPGNKVFVNRGAAGIDGVLSTALGILEGSKQPMLCLMGDLAFYHDSNAMLSARDLSQPLMIVVINNGGGNIFRMLPIYDNKEYFKTYFETPQHAEIEHLAKAHDLKYYSVDTRDKLKKIKPELVTGNRTILVECKTDPEVSMKLRKIFWSGS